MNATSISTSSSSSSIRRCIKVVGTIVDVPTFSRGPGGEVLIEDAAEEQLRVYDSVIFDADTGSILAVDEPI